MKKERFMHIALTILILAGIIGVAFLFGSNTEVRAVPVKILDEITGEVQEEIFLDNPKYERNMMTAIFNEEGINKEIIRFDLISHSSVDKINYVGYGNKRVQGYLMKSNYSMLDALQEPTFIDLRTGEIVEREWKFVYRIIEEYESPIYIKGKSLNGTSTMIQKGTETLTREVWKDYESDYNKNIPKGTIEIWIEVEVKWNDLIDGVWNIGGKGIKEHVAWGSLDFGSWENSVVFNTTGADTWNVPASVDSPITVLIVGAGGGGGGRTNGGGGGDGSGGGGAGGLIYNTSYAVTGGASIDVYVGTGGIGSLGGIGGTGGNGTDSQFGVNNATGGGGGGLRVEGANGGSGGGGSADDPTTWNGGTGVAGQGNAGGNGDVTGTVKGGGGGGSDNAGSGKDGGSGLTRFGLEWACGGGGGTHDTDGGNGGCSSAGDGGESDATFPTNAENYSGSGGGGNGGDDSQGAGEGGHGVVILVYNTTEYPPTVTDIRPLNATNFTVNTFNTNATVFDNINVSKVELYINGTLDQTNNTNGFYNNSVVTFSVTLAEGTHTLQFNATDNETTPLSTVGNLTFVHIKTNPMTTVINPTNTSYSSSDVWFNVTSNVNVSFWHINYNGTNVTVSDQLGKSLNKLLSVEDGNHQFLLYANNSDSGIREINNSIWFTVDATQPTQEFIFPANNTNATTITLPTNLIMNVSVNDTHLDLCLWSNDSYVNNHTYTCNQNQTVNFANAGRYTLYQCANDTLGLQTCGSRSNWIHYYNWSEGATPTKVTEGSSVAFTLFVNRSNIESTIAILEVNKTNYTSPIRTAETNFVKFTQSVLIPNGWGNATGTTILSKWYFNISTIATNVTSGINLNVTSVELDDCSTYAKRILNFTLLNEETKNYTKTGQLIEIDVNLISPFNESVNWNYSSEEIGVNQSDVCVPTSLLENSWFTMQTTTRYLANGHVTEFHHLDNYNLTNETSHQNISLYVLNVSDSTSFLVEYQDEDYLPVENAIIDLLRFYVGEGIYRSVEHGKTDENGQTVLHFVTEEIQYRALVRIDNEIDYQSPDFLALCQETPCQINLQKQDDVLDITNFDTASDLIFDLDFNDTTRNITLTYATRDGSSSTVLLNLTRWDAYLNATICTETETSSAGTLVCNVPLTATNTTYFLEVRSDDSFVAQSSFSLSPNAFENFGYTGIILVGLLFLTLVLIAVPSGAVATLVFGVLGLIFAGMLTIFNGGSILGVGSAMMWLIIAIIIIIIKISGRQRHR